MIAVLLSASVAVLLVAYVIAISSRDLIRLLISLELMFAAVFLAIIPLFEVNAAAAYTVAILTIFTSSSELLVLISAIIIVDRLKRRVDVEAASVGGEEL
ncbi:MAG: NADH-quinone oxidoreductase subunit K [Archaeoglobaceae archaeon]